MVPRGRGEGGGIRDVLSKSRKLKSLRKNNSRRIICTMKTVANNSVLSTKNVLRE